MVNTLTYQLSVDLNLNKNKNLKPSYYIGIIKTNLVKKLFTYGNLGSSSSSAISLAFVFFPFPFFLLRDPSELFAALRS